MTDHHPIVLMPEVLQQFRSKAPASGWFRDQWIALEAAKWGADQELEACCVWLNGGSNIDYDTARLLRVARRPKQPSLKQQALRELSNINDDEKIDGHAYDTIRQALEQLND
jgi:hypothetical protein